MAYFICIVIGVIVGVGVMVTVLYSKMWSLKKQHGQQKAESQRLKEWHQRIDADQKRLQDEQIAFQQQRSEFMSRKISYDQLSQENAMLKDDLFSVSTNLRKTKLDQDELDRRQQEQDAKAKELGAKYLKDHVKWIGAKLNPNNYATSKKQLLQVVELCRGIGFSVPTEQQEELLSDLKRAYEKAVRAEFERQEQARIKAQIRAEQQLEREIELELNKLDRERAAIQAALEKALAEARDEYSEEVERLRARLREAEERKQRAVSRAQMTKSGHVYVISNIGSFGEDVFKVGITRRLEPEIRVRELSSASVPFPFDIHMMISCDDAPALENLLHKALHKTRLNKVNLRKEFFRTDIETIRQVVLSNHGEVEYLADPEAMQYRDTLVMTDEDSEFVAQTYQTIEEDEDLESNMVEVD